MSSPTERAPTTPQYIVASDCVVLGAPLHAGGVDNLNMGVLTASGQPNRPAAVKRLVGLKAADVARLNGGTVDSSSLSILGIHRKFTKRVTTTTHLRHMDLSCCRSIGDLGLSGIATMTQLKHLDLSYCNITDAGLRVIATLTQLQHLNLKYCGGVTDAGLRVIATLTQLQHLNLSYCGGVTDAGLSGIATLKKLQHLNLSASNIISIGLDAISTLTHLQHLDLSACINISDASLQVISTLTQLQHLNLTGCSMIKDLSSIATLTQLKYLDLSLCKKLTDASPRTILTMTQLQHLKLNLSCHVTDTSIHAISALTRLQQLGLSYCNYVTDAGLNAIATLTQLRRLDVSGNDRITDAGLRAISTLTQLQHLDLSGCSSITGVGLHFISQMELQLLNLRGVKITDLSGISTLKHLKHLDLVGCDNITDASLGAISTLTQLQHLNLSRCNNITGAGLCAISTLTELQHLALTDCSNITDAGLSAISTLTQLQHLGLSGCESITDEGLFAISPLTLLQHLDLGQCIKITDAGLHVISSFTWLKHLNLNKCAITHIGLSAILELTQLQYLGLISCRNIKGADIAHHTSERTQLKRLNVIGCCIQRWLNENGAVASVDKCMIQWIEGLWKAALPKDDFVAQFEKYFEFEPYWQHMVLLMKEFGDILPDDENSLELAIDNHFVVKQERESKLFWIAHFSDPVVDFAFHLLHLKKVQPNHNLLLRWLDTYVDPQQPLWPQFLKCFKTKVTKEFILLIFKREFNDEKSDFDGAFQVDLHNHFNALLTQTIQKLKYEPETLSSPVTVERTVSDAVQARWTKRNLWVTKLIHKLDPYDELDSNDNDLGAIYSSEDDDDDDHALLSEALHLPKRSNFVRRQIVIHRVEDEVLKRRQLLPLMASSHQGDDAGFDTLVNCGTYKLLVSDSFMLPAGVDPRYLITSPSNPPQDIQRLGFSAYSSDVKPFINTCEYFADLNDRLMKLLTSTSSKKVLYMMGWMFSLDMRLVPSNDQSTLKHHLINLKHANVEIRILFWRWGNFFLERSFDPLSTDAANTASTLQSIGLLEGEHYLGHRIGKEEGMVATHVYSHHQKHITILDGDNLTAYCGGCDIAVGRFDDATKSVFYNDELEGRYDTSLCNGGTKNDGEAFTLQDFTSGSPRLPWQDVQVRVEGLAALEIAATFEHFFRRAVAEQFPNNNEETLPTLKYAPADPPTTAPNAVVQIVHARDRGYGFEEFMVQLIGKATESIYIEQQHFQGYVSADSRSNHLKNRVPFAIVEKIKERNDPAFNVHVVLPLIPDCFLKFDNAVTKHILRLHHETKVAMMKEIPPHLQQCLKFYYLSSTTQDDNGNTINFPFLVHSKVMIVDKAVCVIGSANINDRSMLAYRDTEMAAVIHSPEVASKLEEDLRRQHAAFLKDFPIDLAQESIGYCNEDVNIQLFTEHDRPNCYYIYDALFG